MANGTFRNVCLCVSVVVSGWWTTCLSAADLKPHKDRRRPMTLAKASGVIFVGNRDSGSVQVIDTDSNRIIEELQIGKSIVALCAIDEERLLAADAQGNEVHLIRKSGESGSSDGWSLRSSIMIPGEPSAVVFDGKSGIGYVASKWSRTLTLFSVDAHDVVHRENAIALPFQPGRLHLLSGKKRLVVTGAFDAGIVEMELGTQELSNTKRIGGHNLGKPALDEQRGELLFPFQAMSPIAQATFNDIHWGNLISNQVHVIPLERSIAKSYDVQLGKPGRGAGDPSCIVALSADLFAVLIAGRNEVQFWRRGPDGGVGESIATIPVGSRPLDAIINQRMLYVANQLSDTISVIDIEAQKVVEEIRLGDSDYQLSLAQRGEQLFFDSRLSLEGWMSCHSCHTDGHSNGQLNDNLSDGGFGSPKRVLSLLGVNETQPWTWTGRVTSLREQVVNSVTKTMQGELPSDEEVDAITAYMASLPPPPKLSGRGTPETVQSSENGSQVFDQLNCDRCHVPPTYTTPELFDVGLSDAEGNSKFNPPSLRGVAQRRAYFHDGRAATLEEVFTVHQHQLATPLAESELKSLLGFLRGL